MLVSHLRIYQTKGPRRRYKPSTNPPTHAHQELRLGRKRRRGRMDDVVVLDSTTGGGWEPRAAELARWTEQDEEWAKTCDWEGKGTWMCDWEWKGTRRTRDWE